MNSLNSRLDADSARRMAHNSRFRRILIPLCSILIFGGLGAVSLFAAAERPEAAAGTIPAFAAAAIPGTIKEAEDEEETTENADSRKGLLAKAASWLKGGKAESDSGEGEESGGEESEGSESSGEEDPPPAAEGEENEEEEASGEPEVTGDRLDKALAALGAATGQLEAATGSIESLTAQNAELAGRVKEGEEIIGALLEREKTVGKAAADIAAANNTDSSELPATDATGETGGDLSAELEGLSGPAKHAFIRENRSDVMKAARIEWRESQPQPDRSKWAGSDN